MSVFRLRMIALAVLGLLPLAAGCAEDQDASTCHGEPTPSPDDDHDSASPASSAPGQGAAARLHARPDDWGPYGVGYREFTWVDAARDDRTLPVAAFYPALVQPISGAAYDEAASSAGLIERMHAPAYAATLNAAPDFAAAPYPVVVFSHGSGARKEEYKFFCEYLASHGFIVVAPDHVGNTGLIRFYPWDLDMSVTRMQDIVFTIDQALDLLEAPGDFEGLGDPEAVGAAGHSWGAATTLSVSGVQFSYDYIAQMCAGQPADPYVCTILTHRDWIEANLPDPRIKAALSLAHDESQTYFGPDAVGAAAIAIPTMLMAGTIDYWAPPARESRPTFAHLNPPAYLLIMRQASHVGMTDALTFGTMPFRREHALIQRYAVAFFTRWLKGDESFEQWLSVEQAADWNEGLNDFEWQLKE